MPTPSSGPISINDVKSTIGTGNGSLTFLDGYIKPGQKGGLPDLVDFYGKNYYQQNQAGNCNNGNAGGVNCNCGNIQCYQSQNCTAINCANCDSQAWLQSGNCAGARPTYNCTNNANCFSYNCNCNCNCSKIICTKLFSLGMMKQNIFEADQAFGKRLIETHPDIYNGYKAWAEIVVSWMEGNGPKMMPWMTDEEHTIAIKNWAINWAYDIATPWAEEMAYIVGEKETGSLTGKLIMGFGTPICKIIGVYNRWFGPSKKEPGFLKGASLVCIFIGFKLIVKIGAFIENFIPKKVGAKL